MGLKLYCEMTDEELDAVDLVEFTQLKVGDRVRHVNEGKMYCPKVGEMGTVLGHSNHGLHHWGGLCVTVDVQFDGGERIRMEYKLVKKEGL